MKRKGIIRSSTVGMTHTEWLKYRECGIGASEMSAVLGYSKYKSNVGLFYEKIGEKSTFTGNQNTFWGSAIENVIGNRVQYWEGTPEKMMENFKNNKIVRKVKNVNAYVHHEDYPFIFASLDREFGSSVYSMSGALEIKNLSGMYIDMWENGIPPEYLVQLQTQLLCSRFKYGELAILRDGRYLSVYPLQVSEIMRNAIIEEGTDFWDRVVKARNILDNGGKLAEVAHLEPEPNNQDAYASFLKNRYGSNTNLTKSIKGEINHLKLARKHQSIKIEMKRLSGEMIAIENQFKHMLEHVECIDFSAMGTIQWKPNKNGVRSFSIKLKNE